MRTAYEMLLIQHGTNKVPDNNTTMRTEQEKIDFPEKKLGLNQFIRWSQWSTLKSDLFRIFKNDLNTNMKLETTCTAKEGQNVTKKSKLSFKEHFFFPPPPFFFIINVQSHSVL